eukprot:gene5780-7190_t
MEKKAKFVAVEWHSAVRQTLGSTIKDVTPQGVNTCPNVRLAVDDTIMDFMMWASPSYAQPIYDQVSTQLNKVYQDFLKNYPSFNGKVSLLAHSLGSVITYDILCNQSPSSVAFNNNYSKESGNVTYWKKVKGIAEHQPIKDEVMTNIKFTDLVFPVNNLFIIGSPIGALFGLRGYTQIPIPQCQNLFNILNQADPVAFLIEPLIDRKFKTQEEIVLPRIDSKVLAKLKKKSLSSHSLVSSPIQVNPSPGTQSPSLHSQNGSHNGSDSSSSSDESDNGEDGADQQSTTSSIDTVTLQVPTTIEVEGTENGTSSPLPRNKASHFSFFGGYRYDYSIKQRGFMKISELTAVLSSHGSYWTSKDTLYFIGNQLH